MEAKLREVLLEQLKMDPFAYEYVPRIGDVLVKIVGDVKNPHNRFGEEIPYKRIKKYLLIRDIHICHYLSEGWFFCIWEVHKCPRTSWLDYVNDEKFDVVLDLEEIYESGSFFGMGKHDEIVRKNWGSIPQDYLYIGSSDGSDFCVSYYINQKVFIESLKKSCLKNIAEVAQLFYMGSLILVQPWGL